ncbi:very low-density lipoprotein receptor-like [Hyperolius riggenbachi]|uniref:very low-density lipoprotein receptor-like n=1 Tax=Hyperolius riggenbachi TaxID=752182 RepID=UPI0035A29BD0
MLEEICISGSTNTVSCLCPDDKRTCSHGEETTEKLPVLEPLVCRRTFVPCRDAKACISIEFVCDGENDCFDGSDEEACTTLCSKQGIFRCVKGIKCIEAKHRCDGVPQCPDESDEENCWKPRESCAIRCDDNRCIPKSWICDGKPDCSDKSDENDCEPKQCSANQFRCNDGQCIPYSMHCDRDNDCEDHSDEQNCTVSKLVFCQRGQFKCQNGKCIPNEWKCDGATDCEDGSDERGCKLKKFICESAEWACTSQDQCVLSVWRCDGIKNCRDGSDELQCEAKNCSDGMFQCKSLDCIPSSFVCNGRHDCLDESDEGGKCGEPCEERCLLSCFRSPYGPKCTCEGGFRMSSNRSHCIDINECKELDPSPCSQSCINNHGSYTCTCHPGYSLQSDGHKCKVTGTEPLLLVSVRFSLLLYKLRTSDVEILTSTEKQSMIFSVDYDALDQKVFYVDHNAETIKWITMDTKVKRTLVKGVKSDCIAVDWIGRNLFWTDGTSGQILATALNATWKGLPEHVVVIDEYLDQPHALVLQPLSGLMYWSEIGVQPQIEEAGMDGSQRKILISEQLGWPTGLALDLLSWKIFWSDEKFRSIGSANLDGTNIKVIQMGAIQRPFALTVFEDEIYWSESEAQTVKKMNKNTATNVSVLIKRHEQPYGLKVIHEVLQPRMDNPCKTLKCSHVCLIGPSLNGSCWCPTGLVLSSNLLDCVPLKHMPFLMVALPKSIFQVILQTSELGYQKSATKTQTAAKTKIAALTNANQFSCFDYVFKDQTLVFAVKYGGYIASLKLSDGSLKDWKTIINVENSVTSVAVDWISGNIYWTSTARPLIQVATSNGRYRAVVIKDDLNKPICLTICPALGIMCYFDAGLGQENSAKIEFANMDGIDRKVLWRKSIAVVGLTLAISGTKLYWADEVHHTIESINVDGSNYKVLRSGLQGLDKFAAGNGVLFWTVYANSTTHVFFADLDMKDIKYFEMEQKVVDLKVYGKPTRQESNACSEKNGDCSQICLPNFEGRRKCRCSAHHYLINNTYCLEALKCPKGFHLCADGLQLQCVHQAYVCDGKQDCSDASDEKNCVHVSENTKYTSTSPLTTKRTTVKHMTYPRFRYSTKGKITLNRATTPVTSAPSTEFEDMDDELTVDGVGRILESKPCTRESCNMRGTCVVENGAVKCQCDEGYSGDYCQDGLSSLAPALTGSTIAVLLVFGIAAGVFVHISRRNALKRTLSSASSRTLTRQSAKDLFPLDSKHTESSETFLNEAFDAEGNTNTEQEHV